MATMREKETEQLCTECGQSVDKNPPQDEDEEELCGSCEAEKVFERMERLHDEAIDNKLLAMKEQ